MSVTALQAAKRACETSSWTLTNLQLQKILYLAHMIYSRGDEGRRLIDEPFEAWDYGPVLPSVYHWVSTYGSQRIKNVFRSIPDIDDDAARHAIDKAVERLSTIAPFKLVDLVHDQNSAWKEYYEPGFRSIAIPQHAVAEEYRRRFGGAGGADVAPRRAQADEERVADAF